jgi:transposase
MSSVVADALDPNALVRENAELKATLVHLETLVEKLQYQIAQLTRRQFGVSAEHLAQLGLFQAGELAMASAPPPIPSTQVPAHERAKPVRRGLPDDLPRQVVTLDLPAEQKACPCCGGERHEIGEEVCEKLDIEPAKMTVLQYRRKKYACRACAAEVQTAPLPAQLIEQGMAAPGFARACGGGEIRRSHPTGAPAEDLRAARHRLAAQHAHRLDAGPGQRL